MTGVQTCALPIWRFQRFGTVVGSGDFADGADYDRDGLVNLLEFGLATSPTAVNTQPLTFVLNGGVARLTYQRSVIAMSDYVFDVIWSDELSSVSWTDNGVTESILSDNGSVQQVQASVTMGSAGRRFFRVRMREK